MAKEVSWLIGAINFGAAQDVEISASAETVAAGDYYLRDNTASISLIDALEAAMTSAGVTTPNVFLDQSGYVRITAGASFTINWTDTALRDALGWTGNITSTTSAVAQKKSPLFWSPGWPETPSTPVGIVGYEVPDTQITTSPTGLTTKHTTHHTAIWQEFSWQSVSIDRVWDAADNGGTFHRFWKDVLYPGYRFYLYSDIQENVGSSSAVVWVTGQGPYKLRRIDPRWYNRGAIGLTDSVTDINIQCVQVTDIS
jgi:hypothetical protein